LEIFVARALILRDVHAEPDREKFDRLVKGQKAALARGLVNQRPFLTVGRAGLERETKSNRDELQRVILF
jgi:hypothetical protein